MIFFITQLIIITYITVKAICELLRNNLDTNLAKPVYCSFLHSNQHMTYLIAIIMYQLINTGTYIMFFAHETLEDAHIHSLLWLKMSVLNVIWLLVIDHFKQERTGVTKITKLKELIKF